MPSPSDSPSLATTVTAPLWVEFVRAWVQHRYRDRPVGPAGKPERVKIIYGPDGRVLAEVDVDD